MKRVEIIRICNKKQREIPGVILSPVCFLCKEVIEEISHPKHKKEWVRISPWWRFWNKSGYFEYTVIEG